MKKLLVCAILVIVLMTAGWLVSSERGQGLIDNLRQTYGTAVSEKDYGEIYRIVSDTTVSVETRQRTLLIWMFYAGNELRKAETRKVIANPLTSPALRDSAKVLLKRLELQGHPWDD